MGRDRQGLPTTSTTRWSFSYAANDRAPIHHPREWKQWDLDENGELVRLPLRHRVIGYCYLTWQRLRGHGLSPRFWFWVLWRWAHRRWPKWVYAAPVKQTDDER